MGRIWRGANAGKYMIALDADEGLDELRSSLLSCANK